MKLYLLDLHATERNSVISEIIKLSTINTDTVCDFQKMHRSLLNNKQGKCPHCNRKVWF